MSKESRIVVQKRYSKGLKGLEDYSHLFILFSLHRAAEERAIAKLLSCPGGRNHLPKIGIFATRNAVHRPNHLGLSLVELLDLGPNVVRVRGLDAFDGSPVLDMKPYVIWDIAGERSVQRRRRGKRQVILDFRGRTTVPEWWSRF
jgi:tRNA (adenine37-N6)-methyltransferase